MKKNFFTFGKHWADKYNKSQRESCYTLLLGLKDYYYNMLA